MTVTASASSSRYRFNVKALIYIAGFAPDAGESVNTLIADLPPETGPPILPPQDGFLLLDRPSFTRRSRVTWTTNWPSSWRTRRSPGASRPRAARSASPMAEQAELVSRHDRWPFPPTATARDVRARRGDGCRDPGQPFDLCVTACRRGEEPPSIRNRSSPHGREVVRHNAIGSAPDAGLRSVSEARWCDDRRRNDRIGVLDRPVLAPARGWGSLGASQRPCLRGRGRCYRTAAAFRSVSLGASSSGARWPLRCRDDAGRCGRHLARRRRRGGRWRSAAESSADFPLRDPSLALGLDP
jgi:hypothetical protein